VKEIVVRVLDSHALFPAVGKPFSFFFSFYFVFSYPTWPFTLLVVHGSLQYTLSFSC